MVNHVEDPLDVCLQVLHHSLVPTPSLPPVSDCLQYALQAIRNWVDCLQHCKQSKNGGEEGLGMRLRHRQFLDLLKRGLTSRP